MRGDEDGQEFIDAEAERRAILEGIEAVKAGQVRDFDEFDREFRERNGIPAESEADARGGGMRS